MRFYQHVKARNDINGNPRRCYVIYEVKRGERWGSIVDVVDEGYGGLPRRLRSLAEIPSVRVDVVEYKELVTMEVGA